MSTYRSRGEFSELVLKPCPLTTQIFAKIHNFAIPSDHIFSSPSSDFATSLMKVSKGNGVDVILDSLTGHLLNESWLCIADGSTMVEIGKRYMLDRNSLSVVPFKWNASIRNQVVSLSLLPIAVDIVNQLFVKTLRLSEPMEPAKPLSGHGLDGLAAVEFRIWVWMELGTELTTLDITKAKSSLSLYEKIVGKAIDSKY